MTRTMLGDALDDLASMFGDGLFADDLGGRFSCREADVIARVLIADDHRDSAVTWLAAHAERDGRHDDHYVLVGTQKAAAEARRSAATCTPRTPRSDVHCRSRCASSVCRPAGPASSATATAGR